jgi:hypothetical protein
MWGACDRFRCGIREKSFARVMAISREFRTGRRKPKDREFRNWFAWLGKQDSDLESIGLQKIHLESLSCETWFPTCHLRRMRDEVGKHDPNK